VRTTFGSATITITLPGIKLSTGVWQINIAHTVCPGFLSIKSILPTPVNNTVNAAGSLPINSVTYGYASLTGNRNNQINSIMDARFSCYQNAVVNLSYTETPLVSVGGTLNFDVTFYYQPNLLQIQDLFLGDSTRPPTVDTLVKSCVPCFVNIQMTLAKLNSTDTPTSVGIPTLMQNIYNYVNGLKFGQTLTASALVSLAQALPIQRVELPILMNGNIYNLNGGNDLITSSDELLIPTDLSNGVAAVNTQYFLDYYTPVTGQVTPSSNIVISLI
jgi:hypothetical protein